MSNTPLTIGGYRLASVVQLIRNGHCWTLVVDGKPMPFLVDRIADANLDTDDVPSVTVTLLADCVQIDNSRTRNNVSPHAWEVQRDSPEALDIVT